MEAMAVTEFLWAQPGLTEDAQEMQSFSTWFLASLWQLKEVLLFRGQAYCALTQAAAHLKRQWTQQP